MRSIRTGLLISILSLSTLSVNGQMAPDFNVTDSHGEEHSLYSDYLNQGKTVLIKIFFTTCPPCNAIAPYMQPLYEEWGAGDFDVEFFELSDKNFDTDALVNSYQENHGQTFPGAGAEGGSLEAVAPYKQGMFGPFFGTPTFVVIAPDGTVTYDVRGSNNQETIEFIDTAIAATGAMKPPCFYTQVINADICPGECVELYGDSYCIPGSYLDTITGGPCDTFLSINIFENPYQELTIDTSFCEGDSVFVNGDVYVAPGVYTDTLPAGINGCDTIVTVVVTLEPYQTQDVNATICQGDVFVYHGIIYDTSGVYLDTIPSLGDGCDTIVMLSIDLAPLNALTVEEEFEEGDSVLVYGSWYSVEGTYMTLIESTTGGCDTNVTIIVTEIPEGPILATTNGKVQTFSSDFPISNATVIVVLEGNEIARDTTGPDGTYTFTLDSVFMAENDLELRVEKASGSDNGVTVLDLLALQKHLLGLSLLNSVDKLFAADLNQSGNLSVLDVLYFRQFLLGFQTGFPNNLSWVFYPQAQTFGAPGLDPPVIDPDPVLVRNVFHGTQSGIFRGIKIGDLNGTADPGN